MIIRQIYVSDPAYEYVRERAYNERKSISKVASEILLAERDKKVVL